MDLSAISLKLRSHNIHGYNSSKEYLNKIDKTSYLIERQKEFDVKKPFVIFKLHVTSNDYHFNLKRLSSEYIAKLYFKIGKNTGIC